METSVDVCLVIPHQLQIDEGVANLYTSVPTPDNLKVWLERIHCQSKSINVIIEELRHYLPSPQLNMYIWLPIFHRRNLLMHNQPQIILMRRSILSRTTIFSDICIEDYVILIKYILQRFIYGYGKKCFIAIGIDNVSR